jgi:DNA-directed RNA polymerase specialized sigma24 family protein
VRRRRQLFGHDQPAGPRAPVVGEEALNVALDRLAPELRAVLRSRFIDGWSLAETALALGETGAGVKRLQARALVELHAALRGQPVVLSRTLHR